MKWRSANEKPKISGKYIVFSGQNKEIPELKSEIAVDYFNIKKGRWNSTAEEGLISPEDMLAWLDPEVPEEFLKPMEPAKKPCPWCLNTDWRIIKKPNGLFIYWCNVYGCARGPEALTAAEAEAAIFERVK